MSPNDPKDNLQKVVNIAKLDNDESFKCWSQSKLYKEFINSEDNEDHEEWSLVILKVNWYHNKLLINQIGFQSNNLNS